MVTEKPLTICHATNVSSQIDLFHGSGILRVVNFEPLCKFPKVSQFPILTPSITENELMNKIPPGISTRTILMPKTFVVMLDRFR